jgi:hypothetical protein
VRSAARVRGRLVFCCRYSRSYAKRSRRRGSRPFTVPYGDASTGDGPARWCSQLADSSGLRPGGEHSRLVGMPRVEAWGAHADRGMITVRKTKTGAETPTPFRTLRFTIAYPRSRMRETSSIAALEIDDERHNVRECGGCHPAICSSGVTGLVTPAPPRAQY